MKNILLLGDSIRVDYDSYVKEILEGEANVYFPEENNRFAEYMLRGISDWAAQLKIPEVNVVHWNAGLWDVLHMGVSYLGQDGEAAGETMTKSDSKVSRTYEKDPLTPPDFYAYYMKRIHIRLRNLFPKATLIFATTTPVIEEVESWAYRFDSEILQYNQIARDVLIPLGSMINELGDFSAKNCHHLHRDWVHYQEEGSRLLAGEIADYFRKNNLL